ncbi:SMC-Scp complex subunit ScpB [Candidatus Woesearchaeota archaeon]|nr:SMC-Scp complex subunit ScpB [Candidatus Woesearchaeota archaeon]
MNSKNKIEAVLFSSGKRMTIEEISSLTGISDFDTIKQAVNELKADYETRGGSVNLVEEAGGWKLNVKDHYLPLVQKIVSKTEIDKPIMETLAVIAWKYPVVQADVVKIRHNKAYDHIRVLEEIGFITRSKYGRTKRISLTEKFFEYFDLPSHEAKQAFLKKIPENVQKNVKQAEKDIDEGEVKIERIKKQNEEYKKFKEQQKEREDAIKKEIKIKKEELSKDEIKDVFSGLPQVQEQDEIPAKSQPDSGKKA